MKRRSLPEIDPAPGWDDFPCKLLTQGFDTYVETFGVEIPVARLQELERLKYYAEQCGRPVHLADEIGDDAFQDVQLSPHGASGGAKFVLMTRNFYVLVRSEKLDWNVTVHYLSYGIWTVGLAKIREAARVLLHALGSLAHDAEPIVSRFDYCFDYSAPTFRPQPNDVQNFLCPGQSKWSIWGKGADVQTFHVGKKNRLQVALYNKSLEIQEASDKQWFKSIWRVADDAPMPTAWRIELRFGSEWLKERNVLGYGAVLSLLPELVSIGLKDRRLTIGNRERTRESYCHPLWYRAILDAGDARAAPASGRRLDVKRDEYVSMLTKQMAGTAISLSYAKHGIFLEDEARRDVEGVAKMAIMHPDLASKINAVQERVRFIDQKGS